MSQQLERTHERCRCCGRSLEGRRRDASYCGAPCRAEASRLKATWATVESVVDFLPVLERVRSRHSAQRQCEREGCETSLAGRRVDARFCSDQCRALSHRTMSRQAVSKALKGLPVQ